jgi:hypothetical protein
MKNRLFSLLTLAVVALAAPATGRAQVISTLSGGSLGGYSTLDGAYGWGQTFQTPGGVAAGLDQFVVRVTSASGQDFQAFISEWTDSTTDTNLTPFAVTSPMLWSGTVTGGVDDLVVFNTGHLALDASTSYAFYIANTGVPLSIPLDPAGPGGAFIWLRAFTVSGTSFGTNFTGIFNLEFEATFSSLSPVPEPATYATIGLALCGVLAVVRRRRTATTTAPVATA